MLTIPLLVLLAVNSPGFVFYLVVDVWELVMDQMDDLAGGCEGKGQKMAGSIFIDLDLTLLDTLYFRDQSNMTPK